MSTAETKAENQSIDLIVAFEKHLKYKYKEIEKKRKAQQDVNYSSFEKELIDKVKDLKHALMEIEIKL